MQFWKTVLIFVLVIAAAGCSLNTENGDGTVLIRLGDSTRSIWYPEGESDFMDIESYKLTFTKGEITVTSEIEPMDIFVMDALSAGEWIVEIEGYNGPLVPEGNAEEQHVSGDQIAYLEPRDTAGNPRNLLIDVNRGEVTQASAMLVPIDNEGTGELEITVNWPQTESLLVLQDPELTIKITNINYRFERYTSTTYEDESQTNDAADSKVITFTDLPLGWYEVVTTLRSQNPDNSGVQIWKGIDFARVTYDPNAEATITTTGTITISDLMLETGSINLTIDEDGFEPLPVAIDDTAAEGTTFDVNGAYILDSESEASVDFSATSGYDSYFWYLDGNETLITSGSAEASYTFTESGAYTVTVVTLQEGNLGSSSAEIVIERHEAVEE